MEVVRIENECGSGPFSEHVGTYPISKWCARHTAISTLITDPCIRLLDEGWKCGWGSMEHMHRVFFPKEIEYFLARTPDYGIAIYSPSDIHSFPAPDPQPPQLLFPPATPRLSWSRDAATPYHGTASLSERAMDGIYRYRLLTQKKFTSYRNNLGRIKLS